MDCRICRFKFHKWIKDGTTIISLIEVNTRKELAYMRYSDKVEKIELEYIVSYEAGKGHASKLIRVLKAIAKDRPIYLDAFVHTVSFFVKHGFVKVGEQYSGELTKMVWKPNTKSI